MRWLRHLTKAAPDLIRGLILGLVMALPGVAEEPKITLLLEEESAVPSNQPLELYEAIIVPPEQTILYVGLVAPMLAGDTPVTFDRAARDMDALCDTLGLRLAAEAEAKISEVVIRLMDQPITYGETRPDVQQFSNAYDISSGACEWY